MLLRVERKSRLAVVETAQGREAVPWTQVIHQRTRAPCRFQRLAVRETFGDP